MTDAKDEAAPSAAVAVVLVVLTVRDRQLQVLLVPRPAAPQRGRWTLPEGFVRADEDLADAAARVLAKGTGLGPQPVHLEQLATYGAPRRDPRGRVVAVGYLVFGPRLPSPAAATWVPVEQALADPAGLAFDHHRILADGVERARSKLEYTPLAAAFCPPEFTIGELRQVYEAVWGQALDPRNFHRKITGTPGFVEPTGGSTGGAGADPSGSPQRSGHAGRPAQLYRRGTAALLHPAMLRAAAR